MLLKPCLTYKRGENMEIIKIVGIGLIATITILMLKQTKPEFAIQVALIAGAIIFFMVISKLYAVIGILNNFAEKAQIQNGFMGIILKVTGIAYITEFASNVCRDSGESSIASKIELGGKLIIITLAIPIIGSLFDILIKIVP